VSIFGGKKKNNIVAVIDISSGSVGGAVFEREKNGKINILGAVRKPANFLPDISFEASWRCAMDALKQTLKKILEISPKGVDEVFCVFSSPWFVSRTKIINFVKEKPFEVTDIFLKKLIDDEEKKYKEEQPEGSVLIEHESVKTELNGYSVKSPAGKKAKTLKSRIYISLGMTRTIEDIKKEVWKNFGDSPLRFGTLPLVVFRVLNDIMESGKDFGVVDINGEVTDIFLIRNDSPEEMIALPKGANLLYRNLASGLNTFMKETPSILRAYARGHRTLESSEKISSAIKKSEEEWMTFFEKALKSSGDKNPLPQDMYFMGDETASKYFIRRAAQNGFSGFTVLGKPANLRIIHPGLLAHYFEADAAGKSHSGNDINLMFEAFYANYY